MLLEALVSLARKSSNILPAGYQEQAIRYIIRLREDGTFIECSDTSGPTAKDRGVRYPAPHVKRAMGVRPKLLADTGEYVLGIGRNDPSKPPNPTRVARQHQSFVRLVAACAQATDDPSVQAIARFLEGDPVDESELGVNFDASATVSFRVNHPDHVEGVLPVALPSVRSFWASRLVPEEGADTSSYMHCIVCNTFGPVLERHPFKIKGIPGGQIQKDLISANASAFESYGLKASQIAPTCQTCAEAYANALNDLLADKTKSLWTKELAYAFWTEDDDNGFGSSVVGFMSDPEAHSSEIRELLTSFYSGNSTATAVDETAFYSLALGASGARVVVKDWLDTTVGAAKLMLGRYFALQDIVDAWGEAGRPLPLFRLTSSTVFKSATPSPIVSQSLIRNALKGGPIPLDMLFMAVRRNRAEQNVTRERATLIKMVLGSQKSVKLTEAARMTSLDSENHNPAYLCGRLLATLDRVQRIALGTTNASIIDKYYGTASSAPAAVFGTLLHGAQNHLGKMRRDRPGAHRALEEQLEQTLAPLGAFPTTLSLPDQGMFALGFYHQRADDRAKARANREKRNATAVELDDPADAESDAS